MTKYLVLKPFTVYHWNEKNERTLGYYDPGMEFDADPGDSGNKVFAAMIQQQQIERVRAD